MSNCQKYHDLILTDYMDGELNSQSRQEIENHLQHCNHCLSFAKEVEKDLVLPFKNISSQEVPQDLRESIYQRIDQEQQARNPIADFLNNLRNFFLIKNYELVYAVLIFFLCAGIFTTYNRQAQIKQAKEQEQGIYLASVFDTSELVSDSNDDDVGSDIEEYFL